MPRHNLKWIIEIAIFAVSGTLAFLLRFDYVLEPPILRLLLYALPIWIAMKSVAFYALHIDRIWWTFVSIPDVFRIGVANCAGSLLSAVVIVPLLASRGFPRSVYVLDLIICVLLTAAALVAARARDAIFRAGAGDGSRTVLIHGAGRAGIMLLREIEGNPSLGMRVCGFTDDDPRKQGMFIEGQPVLGSACDIATLVAKLRIEQILVAIPSATGAEMTAILRQCHNAGVTCKTIPGLSNLVQGHGLVRQMRDVAVEDLLGRKPVQLDTEAISSKLGGKVVMVTGAAGSIGSELCRQVAGFCPDALVAFDFSETALFFLNEEMRRNFPELPFHPEVGSIQSPQRLAEVLERYKPSILYHAAAYKHVPMMEAHLFEAVENNVLGTWNVAVGAALHNLTDFVMISSDKAVHPTSVMGLTKRVAELLVHSLQNGTTKFVSVRFGNVLGSNGSVVPIFKQQIAAGGPVRVTHPEMRRYFMTTSEAVQLVLQASTMGKGGEIFVLDMGQPVRILDLAVNLILLSGLRPHEDIKIEFTGVRPGEKLSEELHSSDDETQPTFHEKINIYESNGSPPDLCARVEMLRDLCARRQAQRLLLELKQLVPDYNPSCDVLTRLFARDAPAVERKPPATSSVPERNVRMAFSGGN